MTTAKHNHLILPFGMMIITIGLIVVAVQFAQTQAAPFPNPAWEPNVRANSDSTTYSQHEPSLAISRTDPNVVVVAAKDYRIGDSKQVWIYVSQDGGLTWPVELQRQVPGLPADVPNQSDPVVVGRDDGRIYVICLGHNNGHGLFITWSDDDGVTWQDAVAITHNETPGGLDDKEWLAIDNNPTSPYYHNMYVAWATGGILFKRSTDGGQTWSSPYQNIAPGDTEYPYPVVGADGTLYVFYMDGWGYCADGEIRYVKSTNGGVSFSGPYIVTTTSQPCSPIHGGGYDQFRFFSIITAAADPNNPDNLWAAWTDDNNVTYGKTDVLYVRSTDGGVTWSAPERLSHDDPEAYVDHITPVFAIGQDSRLHAFWLDRRADPQNHLFQAYHTSTRDGGLTWEPDTQVSDQAFDLNIYFPPPSGYNAAGDYWGLDTVGNIVMAAWNTTVENSQDIYVARGIFTDTLPVTLTGQVSDAVSGAPLSGATIQADPSYSTASDPAGAYTLTLPAGVYTLTVSTAGYDTQVIAGLVLISGTLVQDFALDPIPATLTGQVRDAETSQPLPGATISAGISQTLSGSDGMYSLTIPSGTYTLTISASGYHTQTLAEIALPWGTTTMDFILVPITVPVTVSGQVSDALFLTPLVGAEVTFENGPTVTTGANGAYQAVVAADVYTVTASATGYQPQSVTHLALISGSVILDFSLNPEFCPLPVIQDLTLLTDGLSVTMTAIISSELPVSYFWEFGDGITSTEVTPAHTYSGFGTYTLRLTVTNACGSQAWAEIILIAPAQKLYIPLILR